MDAIPVYVPSQLNSLYCKPHHLKNPSSEGEQVQLEKKEFTNWMNSYLQHAHCSVRISSIEKDLADGVTLLHFVQHISFETPPCIHFKPALYVHRLENIDACLSFLEKLGVELNGIHAEDIVRGNIKTLLALCRALYVRFEGGEMLSTYQEFSSATETESKSDDSGFTVWYKEDIAVTDWIWRLLDHELKDYSEFADGILLCAIVNRLWNGCITQKDVLYSTPQKRLEIAAEVAEEFLGVQRTQLDIKAVIARQARDVLPRYLLQLKAASEGIYREYIVMQEERKRTRDEEELVNRMQRCLIRQHSREKAKQTTAMPDPKRPPSSINKDNSSCCIEEKTTVKAGNKKPLTCALNGTVGGKKDQILSHTSVQDTGGYFVGKVENPLRTRKDPLISGKPTLPEKSIREDSMQENTIDGNGVHNSRVYDGSFHGNGIHDTSILVNSIHDTSIHDTSIHDTSIHDTSIHDTSIHDTSIHDTSIHDTSIHDTSIHDTSIHDTSIHDTSIHDTSIHDTSIHDTSIHDTSIHDTSIHSNSTFGDDVHGYRNFSSSEVFDSAEHLETSLSSLMQLETSTPGSFNAQLEASDGFRKQTTDDATDSSLPNPQTTSRGPTPAELHPRTRIGAFFSPYTMPFISVERQKGTANLGNTVKNTVSNIIEEDTVTKGKLTSWRDKNMKETQQQGLSSREQVSLPGHSLNPTMLARLAARTPGAQANLTSSDSDE